MAIVFDLDWGQAPAYLIRGKKGLLRMGKSCNYPDLCGGILFRDEYEGVYAYLIKGSKEKRFKVLEPTSEIMRARMAEDGKPLRNGDSIKLEVASLPSANHVLERDRPSEIKRIRKALPRRFRRDDYTLEFDWSSSEPHTGDLEQNKYSALVSVLLGGKCQTNLRWDGKNLTEFDPLDFVRKCGCSFREVHPY